MIVDDGQDLADLMAAAADPAVMNPEDKTGIWHYANHRFGIPPGALPLWPLVCTAYPGDPNRQKWSLAILTAAGLHLESFAQIMFDQIIPQTLQ